MNHSSKAGQDYSSFKVGDLAQLVRALVMYSLVGNYKGTAVTFVAEFLNKSTWLEDYHVLLFTFFHYKGNCSYLCSSLPVVLLAIRCLTPRSRVRFPEWETSQI